MLSQLFVLSARGDIIITRDFRGDLVKGTNEVFFRKFKLWDGEPPPVFAVEGVNFMHVKRNGLFFVGTTTQNISPSYVFDIILNLIRVIKDYCGVLSEESIRKNFILVYELIDEMIDYGHAQSTSTEQVRPFIVNEPILVDSSSFSLKPHFFSNSVPCTAVQRPVTNKKSKNEIFVDVLEKLTVLFNSNGYIMNSSLEGCIQMKSFLKNNPQLQLALNDDLVIEKNNAYGNIGLDDFNFHECVNASDFKDAKILIINPPDGEFVVMNYRIKGDYQTPFRIFPYVEEITQYKLDFSLKIKSLFPEKLHASNVSVKFNVPRTTSLVNFELSKKSPGQKVEYKESERIVEWTIEKFMGSSEISLKTKAGLTGPATTKEINQISMNFEISMYNVSKLQIKYLRITGQGNSNPYRWVRYITQSSSYVCRV
jgi:AP-4 complex subunit mu-1